MYKRIAIIIYLITISFIYGFSQNHIDALRYSQQFYSTSAKSDAMGNSLSAVGADFSAFMINPAGIAIYKTNQMSFTPNLIISKTTSSFSGVEAKDGRVGFNFSSAGYVAVHENDGILKSVNLGISYNSFNDFRQRLYAYADNQQSSFLDYAVYNANNNRYSDFREDLAYNTYLLEYDEDGYYSWVTEFGKYGNSQAKSIDTNGGGGEFSFTIGFNINDILYLGGTIGLTSINYSSTSVLNESGFENLWVPDNDNPGDSIQVNPSSLKYTEVLETDGSGINAKFGFILQPVKFFRLGASIHSSTAYDFTDYYSTYMNSVFPIPDENGAYEYNAEAENIFDWRLTTPFRANVGIAFILDAYKIGNYYTTPITLSVDYEYVDYTRAFLRDVEGGDYSFYTENSNIANLFQETHNIRAGVEFNFGVIKVRGGYSIYSNPYAEYDYFTNPRVTYSGGIGFADQLYNLDLSYSYSTQDETLYLYDANNVFPNDPIGNIAEPQANLTNSKHFFKITFGVRL
ncbi:MAG: hypothetical protein GXO49_00565 [Chlorobi bacterium]|nr:hypothetical protein [Chlorobiota bacterium]